MSCILERWAALALAVAVVGVAFSASAPSPEEKDERSPAQVQAAKDDLGHLRKLAEDPKPDLEDLWMTWQRFRTKHSGTPEWVQACEVMRNAPSPLDHLNRNEIPEEERFDWQPPGLVAVLGEHRARAWGAIDGLAVSPDGQMIATTGGGLWLWDTATQRDKILLVDRQGWGVPVFSPDGRTLAAQSGTDVCIWDLTGARPRKRMSFNANPAVIDPKFDEKDYTRRISLVGNGKTLIAGGYHEYRWWEVSGDEPKEQGKLAVNQLLATEGEALHFASDGRTAVGVAGGVNQFRVFDWNDGQLKARAAIPGAIEGKTAFSADVRTLAMLVNGGEVLLWDLTTAKPTPKAKSDGMKCNGLVDLVFAPDGRLLATLDRDNTLWLWALDADAAKTAGMKPGETVKKTLLPFLARRLCLTPDRRTMVVGCEDGTLHLWDVAADRERVPLRGQTGPVEQIAFSPNGRTLAVLGQDGWARLWDIGEKSPRERTSWRAHRSRGRSLLFTLDGKGLLTLGFEEAHYSVLGSAVRLWDLTEDQPKVLRMANYADDWFQSMTLSPDGRFLALGGRGPLPDDKLHDSGLARLVDPLEDGLPTFYDIRPAPTDFKGTSFGQVQGAAENEVSDVNGIAFSPDGKTLALTLHASTRCLSFSTKIYKEWAVIVRNMPTCGRVLFTPDSKQIVIAGVQDEGVNKPDIPMVRLWDVKKTPPQPGPFWVTEGKLTRNIQVFPDGTLLLSFRENAGFEMWDVAKPAKLFGWEATGLFGPVSISPDGRYFATANANGTVYIVRIAELRKQANPDK